jgi:putative hydrolase of the HAD superfamily
MVEFARLSPRAVLFDFGGTLDADGVAWKERFAKIYGDEGLALPDQFDQIFYQADDALAASRPEHLSLDETVERLAREVSAGLGVGDDALTARVARRFLDESRVHLGRSVAILSRLARRHRLGIVSNFYGNLLQVCHDCGILPLLGAIVDSARAGFVKPDPRIFRVALAGLGVNAAEVVVVGDSLARDMAGARAAGIKHIWLAGPAAAWAQPCCPEDLLVTSLADAEELLR